MGWIFGRRKAEVFDWNSVPTADPEEVRRWLGATDGVTREFPLALALQVHDELESALMRQGPADAAYLSEIRGGLKALRRFCQVYSAAARPRAAAPGVNIPQDEEA